MILIVALLIGIVAGVAIFIATRPAEFRLERSAQIDAPAARVFALIDDFHDWVRWSPWEKLDPRMQKTFSGPNSGLGSVYKWSGNSKAGEGQMTLLTSTPGELVVIELKFIRPFRATNLAKFQLTREGTGTRVVWSMEGKHTLMSKAFWPMMSKMVAKDFDEGLANLNRVARGTSG